MIKRRLLLVVLCGALAAAPLPAASPTVTVETASIRGTHVTLVVHNYSSGPMTIRVQVQVVLPGGVKQTLTSANITVAPGATVTVTLTACARIVSIGDDPQPILPIP